MITAWWDGSCWPNPGGPCCYGYVIKRDGVIIRKGRGRVKIVSGKMATNNVAEYAGLLGVMRF